MCSLRDWLRRQCSIYDSSPSLPQFLPLSLLPRRAPSGLVVDFERLCQEKVREEESVRDQFHTSIAQLQQEVGELTARLGVSDGKAEGWREEGKKEMEGSERGHRSMRQEVVNINSELSLTPLASLFY